MHIKEYIEKAKRELDDMQKMFEENYQKNPVDWVVEMAEEEWVEQEFAARFE
jgi:hypothetical protein